MNGRDRWLYPVLILAWFAAVCMVRGDLVAEAWQVCLGQFHKGGAARLKLLAEVALFALLFALALRTAAVRPDPGRDLALAGLGLTLGYLVEAWGTRAGLWRYYTRETPPLWILPFWTIGAVAADRIAEAFRRRWRGAMSPERSRRVYWAAAALMFAVTAAFAWRRIGHPATPAVLAGVAAALALGTDPERDVWVLAAGMLYVLPADFWGTTNHCWHYYPYRFTDRGIPFGVAFGVCFDTAVVLAGIKLARLLRPR